MRLVLKADAKIILPRIGYIQQRMLLELLKRYSKP